MLNTLFESKHTKIIQTKEGLEYMEIRDAACILAIDQEGFIIMVEQNRGPFGTVLEVPAGGIEKGEEPLNAAIRELEEETGNKTTTARHLISYYPTVGYSTEEIHCYFTNVVIDTGKQNLDENEHVKIKRVSPEDLYDMIQRGEIKDSKTIMCVNQAILNQSI